MNTFLPYPDARLSCEVLDMERLGKQRVECLQIMQALCLHQGWVHHPATRMWEGYEGALLRYTKVVCDIWTDRGGKDDTCFLKTQHVYNLNPRGLVSDPWWMDMPRFHAAMRANLHHKDPDYYGDIHQMENQWTTGPLGREYLWPQPEWRNVFRIGRKQDKNGFVRLSRTTDQMIRIPEGAKKR